jgi:hypothetical protein
MITWSELPGRYKSRSESVLPRTAFGSYRGDTAANKRILSASDLGVIVTYSKNAISRMQHTH